MDAALTGRGAAIAAAVGVAVLAGWEPLPQAGTHLLGVGGVDHAGTVWTWGAVRDAVGAGAPERLLHTPWFYHPWGQALYRHTGLNLLDALLALPFGASTLGQNLALVSVLLLNGLAGAWAARRSGAAAAGWVGLALAVAPYPLYELVEGRPTQALLAPAVLAGAAWMRLPSGSASPVLAGALLALTGYGYWFYGLIGALCGLLTLPWTRARGAVALAVAAALAAPVAGPLAWAAALGEVPGGGAVERSAPLLLHAWQPLAGGVGYLDGERFVGTQAALPVALVLAAGWAWRRRPAAWLVAGLLAVLAVGPWVVVGEALYPEPVYRGLAAVVPPLDRWWHPARTLGMLTALAVLAVGAIGPRLRVGVVALLMAESARAGLLPLPSWDARPPAAYRCLAALDDGKALIELPWPATPTSLAWQPLHRRPVLGGMWEVVPELQPPEAVALRAEDPFLAGLLARARGMQAALGTPEAVRALGYGWVVLRRDELPPEDSAQGRAARRRVDAALREALGAPAWDDARATVWSLDGGPLSCAEPPDRAPGARADRRRVRDRGERPVRAR